MSTFALSVIIGFLVAKLIYALWLLTCNSMQLSEISDEVSDLRAQQTEIRHLLSRQTRRLELMEEYMSRRAPPADKEGWGR